MCGNEGSFYIQNVDIKKQRWSLSTARLCEEHYQITYIH